MRDITSQLKKLEVEMSESFIVHYILNTIPQWYEPFKISYNTRKYKWSINELIIMCVQENIRLIMEQCENVMLTTTHWNRKAQTNQNGKGEIPPQVDIKKEAKSCFYKKKGHEKKGYAKFKKWLDYKGNLTLFVCYESNMINVNIKT